jgi:hypothetical protein
VVSSQNGKRICHNSTHAYTNDSLLLSCTRLNTCPFQGSRTIRTEEAVLISLSQLSSPLAKSALAKEAKQEEATNIEFSDAAPSEESSSSEESGDEDGTSDEESA